MVVVGGAAMEAVSVVDALPEPGTSVQARSFSIRPGGAGARLAVAAARAGLPVHLVAAVGGDESGRAVVGQLAAEGVATALTRQVPNETTPVTQVIELPDGDSCRLSSWNTARVGLRAGDLCRRSTRNAVVGAAAVFVTLEVPVEVVVRTVRRVRGLRRRPLLVLHVAATECPPRLRPLLAHVDYVIGSAHGVCRLVARDTEGTAVRTLLDMGVAAVGVLDPRTARLHSGGPVAELSVSAATDVLPAAVPAIVRMGRGPTRRTLAAAGFTVLPDTR